MRMMEGSWRGSVYFFSFFTVPSLGFIELGGRFRRKGREKRELGMGEERGERGRMMRIWDSIILFYLIQKS